MLKKNVLLSKYSYYKIGGQARYFLVASDIKKLADEIKKWRAKNINGKIFILGGGTNVLFSDRGFDGLVVLPKIKFIKNLGNNTIEVGASTEVGKLINYLVEKNLSNLEWAAGLPGTIGGAIFGNAGAFGKEIKDNIINVKSISLDNFDTKERIKNQCLFAYRTSIFKKDLAQKEIIVSAKFKFKSGKKEKNTAEIHEKLAYRKAHQPLEYPNIGSTFKNVNVKNIPKSILFRHREKIKNDPFPIIPAAVFLSEAGLKGRRIGDIEISKKHPNFFVNFSHGKASDVQTLIKLAQKEVKRKFNIELEPEIIEVKF